MNVSDRPGVLPSRSAIALLLGGATLALLAQSAGVPARAIWPAATALLILLLAWAVVDGFVTLRTWRAAPLQWTRRLPDAFALGVATTVCARLLNRDRHAWRVQVFDHADPDLDPQDLPIALMLKGGADAELAYRVQPRRRGAVTFEPAALRVASRGGSLDFTWRIGAIETRPVLPNFAAVARYAWLAGDRRLADIGIKTQVQRGEGTDFKQLAEYSPGGATRHIDWKATLRHQRPIVREFQDERDQCVLFLLDGGRRMRADEGSAAHCSSHFDEALNALMLLAHVALKDGDAVGALTFGTGPAQQRRIAPRKGRRALAALTAALHDVQPEATHSDYAAAARDLMRLHAKRSLVVLLTNFRDEDLPEIQAALALLRTRHLVLVASLRERALRELAEQALADAEHVVEVAGAHLFTQARRDAFARLAAHDALMLDVEPERLAAELVNRYRAVKRSGLL